MKNAELIKALRCEKDCDDCAYHTDNAWSRCDEWGMRCDAADELEAADKRIARLEEDLKTREAEREVMQDTIKVCEKRIAELEDELRFQLDTRRKETAEIERLKAENLKLQKQNRDCGWNCKQCEYVDKDLQAEEAEQRLMELDRRLYELRSFNAKMKGEQE